MLITMRERTAVVYTAKAAVVTSACSTVHRIAAELRLHNALSTVTSESTGGALALLCHQINTHERI